MKPETLYEAMKGIDDELLEESEIYTEEKKTFGKMPEKTGYRRWTKTLAACACLALIVFGGAWTVMNQRMGSSAPKEKEAAEMAEDAALPEQFNGEDTMKLRNVLIVVKDIEKSRQYYEDLFGLEVLVDNDGNMILTEGLVLQDEKIWKEFTGCDIVERNNASELYFEEKDIEAFVEKLDKLYPETIYVNRLMTHSWGQKVVRFYDPDGNLIEVGTPFAIDEQTGE